MIYIEHWAVFGLSPAGGIQGTPADAAIAIFMSKGIDFVIKWVDDFAFFRSPINSYTDPSGILRHIFCYDLDMILAISEPLGIPWHPVLSKGQDFATTFEYSGFDWDLVSKTVSLPDRKRLKKLAKLNIFLESSKSTVNRKDCTSLHGSLQHITVVYRDGQAYLPLLSHFLSKFPNNFVRHHVPASVVNHLLWWKAVLNKPSARRSLEPRWTVDPDIWVDASMSWGIGIVVGNHWAAWRLLPGWKSDGRDIGWAESVALELAVMWLVQKDFHDADVRIWGDNTGVIGAFLKGRSRSIPRNDTTRRITSSLIPFNLTISPSYVASSANRADPISRGVLGSSDMRLVCGFELPSELQNFLAYV
jgi:hypothetical protein